MTSEPMIPRQPFFKLAVGDRFYRINVSGRHGRTLWTKTSPSTAREVGGYGHLSGVRMDLVVVPEPKEG